MGGHSKMRNMFRDFFRRIRVRRHLARHGANFQYHGLSVAIPEDAELSVANALIRGKYEREEAEMIVAHLPPDMPVIELGGSLGVVSRLIRSRLAPNMKHLIVEANADLLGVCRKNASVDAPEGQTEVVNAALFYGGPVARFRIGREPHANSLDNGSGEGRVVEVPAVTLADLLRRIGNPPQVALVADIEGAEFDLFRHDSEALRSVQVAIVELHPRDYPKRGLSEHGMLELLEAAGFAVVERRADVVLLRRKS
jgi:FkbM family methyltransferase